MSDPKVSLAFAETTVVVDPMMYMSGKWNDQTQGS